VKVRLRVAESDGNIQRFILCPTAQPMEMYDESHGCQADAKIDQPLVVSHQHCDGCLFEATRYEVLGLTEDEAQHLIDWRKRKEMGVSAADMGRLLDKVAAYLAKDVYDCPNAANGETLMLRLETYDV
jgi:hypothetical protein